MGGAVPIDLPPEQRLVYRLFNVGWNSKPDELRANAKDLFSQACKDDPLPEIYPVTLRETNTGSQCDVWFDNPQRGAKAQLKVKMLKMCYRPKGPDDDWAPSAWLVPKRTKAENMPRILVHRIYDRLVLLESTKSDKKDFQKCLSTKDTPSIKLDGDTIGWATGDKWTWTNTAKGRYSSQDLDMAVAHALST